MILNLGQLYTKWGINIWTFIQKNVIEWNETFFVYKYNLKNYGKEK